MIIVVIRRFLRRQRSIYLIILRRFTTINPLEVCPMAINIGTQFARQRPWPDASHEMVVSYLIFVELQVIRVVLAYVR